MRQGSFRDGFSARPLQEPTKISRTKLGLRIVQGVQRLVSDGKIVATTGHILLDSWKSVEVSRVLRNADPPFPFRPSPLQFNVVHVNAALISIIIAEKQQ